MFRGQFTQSTRQNFPGLFRADLAGIAARGDMPGQFGSISIEENQLGLRAAAIHADFVGLRHDAYERTESVPAQDSFSEPDIKKARPAGRAEKEAIVR